MRNSKLNLVMALCTFLGLIGFSAGALAAGGPGDSTPVHVFACDFYHPQDCTVNMPPPTTPFVPTVQAPANGTCQPPAPNSPINPAFKGQWDQGQALAPNFWGPTYTVAFNEQYTEGSTGFSESGPANPGQGMRLVQYFDKGRMELTHPASGIITSGLLANELISGQLQLGDNTFQQRAPANVPIAGDPENAGPTYAGLGTRGAALFAPAMPQIPTERNLGVLVETRVAADGTVTTKQPLAAQGAMAIAVYDDTTKHNVPQAFADYRNKVSLQTIGYAKSEPFLTTVKVAGQQRQVMVQVFERRVLTYTADNSPAFQVEMGNIGVHYYRWRYCGA